MFCFTGYRGWSLVTINLWFMVSNFFLLKTLAESGQGRGA
jgi:hypothetical protein